jgi:hypothetical protein
MEQPNLFIGRVTQIAISGSEIYSTVGELNFTIEGKAGSKSFDITPGFLPQVYAAMAAILTTAYLKGAKIEVKYTEEPPRIAIVTNLRISDQLT